MLGLCEKYQYNFFCPFAHQQKYKIKEQRERDFMDNKSI
jgi:hypothetical protein